MLAQGGHWKTKLTLPRETQHKQVLSQIIRLPSDRNSSPQQELEMGQREQNKKQT